MCPLQDDSTFALNVKRAVLSALQVSVDADLEQVKERPSLVSEDDIVGRCDTQYEVLRSGAESVDLVKRKLLGTCTDRVQMQSGLRAGSAVGEVLLRALSSAGLQQKHECHLQVSRPAGIVLKADCAGHSDADQMFADPLRFISSMTVRFNNEQPIHYPPLNGPHRVQSLLGSPLSHHSNEAQQLESSLPLAKAVQNICDNLARRALDSATADSFDQLVRSMRNADFDSLHAEFQRLLGDRNHALTNNHGHDSSAAPDSNKCCPHRLFKVYVDAVKSTKTEHSLKLLVSQLVPFHFYHDINDWRGSAALRSFYSSLAFYPAPTVGTLEAARPLLQTGHPKHRAAVIGVSGLIRAYVDHNPDQADSPLVQKLAHEIAGSERCIASKADNQIEIDNRLHALQNFKSLPDDLVAELLKCATNTKAPLGTRVAALKAAHRRKHMVAGTDTSSQPVADTARQLLFDDSQPIELRAASYRPFIRHFEWEKHGAQLQSLIDAGGEVASYIASHVANLRAREQIKCPVLLNIRSQLDSLRGVEQAALSGRSRRTVFHPQLGYILRDQLGVSFDLISDAKTEQSYAIKASARLAKSKLISVSVRQTLTDGKSGQVGQLADAAQTLIQSVLNGGEQFVQRVQQVLPNLQAALQGAEFTVRIDGKLIYYRAANEKKETAAKQLISTVQSGLSELLAYQNSISMQVQGFSGVPSTYTLRRTMLLSVPQLLGSPTAGSNERAFDLLPNMVIRSELLHRIAVGTEQHLVAQLQRRSYLSSGFSVHASLKLDQDGWQLRLRLPTDQVELFTYRVHSSLQQSDRPAVALQSADQDAAAAEWRLDHLLPIKSLFGVSVLVKRANGLRRVVIEQEPGSSLLISDLPIRDASFAGRRYALRLENGGKPRELSFERRFGKTQVQNTLLAKSPLVNANAQANISDHAASVSLQLNDGEYELRWSRERQPQGEHGYRVLHLLQINPSSANPLTIKGELTVDRKTGLRVGAQLSVDEKRKLIDFMYEHVQSDSRVKRAAPAFQTSLKSAVLRLQVNSLRGRQLWNGVHVWSVENDVCKYDSQITYVDYFHGPGQQMKHEFALKMLERTADASRYELEGKMSATALPLNVRYWYKLWIKFPIHFEHELRIQPDAADDKSIVQLTHVATAKNFDRVVVKGQPLERTVSHLWRVQATRYNFNREYTLTANPKLQSHPRAPVIGDAVFKARDLATAKSLMDATLKLAADPSDPNNRLILNFNLDCAKHGKIDLVEHIEFKDDSVHKKIALTMVGADASEAKKYSGEYRASSYNLWPKQFEMSLTRDSDGKRVLHLERDFTTYGEPLMKVFSRAQLMDETLYDYSIDYERKKHEGEISLVLHSIGQLTYSRRVDGRSDRRKLAALTGCGYLHVTEWARDPNVLDVRSNLRRLTRSVKPLHSKSIADAESATDSKSIISSHLQMSNARGLSRLSKAESIEWKAECPSHRILFKHDSPPKSATTKLEIENLDKQRKLMLMSTYDSSRLVSIAFQAEEAGRSKLSGDLSIGTSAPSVLNVKREGGMLHVTFDPLRTKATATEWPVWSIQAAVKSTQLKHSSSFKIRTPQPTSARVFELISKTEGRSERDQTPFENSAFVSISSDIRVVRIEVKKSGRGRESQAQWEHEWTQEQKPDGSQNFKLIHQVRLQTNNRLWFAHKLETSGQHGNGRCELNSKSQFDATDGHWKGAGVELSFANSRVPLSTKASLSIAYPYRGRSYSASLVRRGRLGQAEYVRQLNAQLVDKKLDYKDSLQMLIDAKTTEFLAKYERRSLANHSLEHLEFHAKLHGKPSRFIKVIAPRGWKAEFQFDETDSSSFKLHVLLQKRGRLVFSANSEMQKSAYDRTRRSLLNTGSIKIQNTIGWNGNAKQIEEVISITENLIDYKLKGLSLSIDANLKRSEGGRSMTGTWNGCTGNGKRCCTIQFERQSTDKGAKGNVKATINHFEKPIEVQFDFEKVKTSVDQSVTTITGQLNSQPVKGEVRVEGGRHELRIQLPQRVIVLSKERKSDSVVQLNLWPDHGRKPQYVHTFEVQHGDRKVVESSIESGRHFSIKFTSPAIKTPAQFVYTKDLVRNKHSLDEHVKMSLDYSPDAGHRLTYEWVHERLTNGSLIRHALKSNDKKIDAGCEIKMFGKYDPKHTVESEVSRSCHWMDSSGKLLIGGDFNSMRLNQVLLPGEDTVFQIQSGENLITVYRWAMGVRRLASIGHSLWFELKNVDLPLQRIEYSLEGPCARVVHKQTDQSVQNRLSACVYGSSNQTLAKIRLLFGVKPGSNGEEQLLVQLEKAPERDLRLIVNWDPEAPGLAISAISKQIDEQLRVYERNQKKAYEEIYDKSKYMYTNLNEKLVQPLVQDFSSELQTLKSELNWPALARSRRSIDDAVDEPPQSFKDALTQLFNVRVVKYQLEAGEIEILFRPHPTGSGIRKVVRQTLHYLLNPQAE